MARFSGPDHLPRIGVLVNPLSGGNRGGCHGLAQRVAGYAQARLMEVRSPGAVATALAGFLRRGVDLVVVSGGDGTVQAALTALYGMGPTRGDLPLMILRAGTTSMTAGDVGVRGSQPQALDRLFRWAETGQGRPWTVRRPVLRVRVPGHGVHCGMFFGAAGISHGIRFYHSRMHARGIRGGWGIGWTLLTHMAGAVRPNGGRLPVTAVSVFLDDQPLQADRFRVLLVSTLERLFFGLRPFWGAGAGPLRFSAMGSRARHLPRVLPHLIRGKRAARGTPANGYFSRNAHKIRLFLDSTVTLDGQLYTPTSAAFPTCIDSGGIATFVCI